MVENARAFLRQLLVSGYDDLRRRLARRLGSPDIAAEVLHETWIRLDHVANIAVIEKPKSYLYRMALNVAADQRRAETRWSGKAELEALLHSEVDLLDPEYITSVRSEMVALERALGELPARRRAIFTAALLEELTYREIAERFGVSLRSVEREMSRAFDHCSKRLEKSHRGRRAGGSRDVLHDETAQVQAADNDDEH